MAVFDYASRIIDIPDYPEPGVIFKDITPLFSDAQGMAAMVEDIAGHFADRGITKVVGPEARGFMVGVPVAYKLGAGFIPARKPGTDSLEIHIDAIQPGDKVLIVDDLVATGGTAAATARLVQEMGAEFAGFACILELAFLNPRKTLAEAGDHELYSLVKVE